MQFHLGDTSVQSRQRPCSLLRHKPVHIKITASVFKTTCTMSSFIHFPVVPNSNIGPLSGFLWSHIQLDTWQDSSERMISPSQRPLHTHDNTTYIHDIQTSMPLAGFEPATPASARPRVQCYCIGQFEYKHWAPRQALCLVAGFLLQFLVSHVAQIWGLHGPRF
jgi:hypothetical protein